MGIAEEMGAWGGDPRMDHGYRQRTPGYREYSNQVVNDMGEGYIAGSGIPVVADAVGLNMDYKMFRDKPETRTPWNFAWAGAAAALPFVPNVARSMQRGMQNMRKNKNMFPQKQLPEITQYPPPRDTIRQYHGTNTQALVGSEEFKGDVGVHVGTKEQAEIRLQNKAREEFNEDINGGFGPNANIHPLQVTPGNSLRMDDIGAWDNPHNVIPELKNLSEFNNPTDAAKLDDILESWKWRRDRELKKGGNISANSQNEFAFRDTRNLLKDKGYDSIIYRNEAENPYKPGYENAHNRASKAIEQNAEAFALSTQAGYKGKGIPGFRAGIPYGNSDNLTNWQLKEKYLKRRRNYIHANSKTDDDSLLILQPENVRSQFAQFDPAKRGSKNPMAGFIGLGLTGLAGRQMMDKDDGI